MLSWGKHAVISMLVCPKINTEYFHFHITVSTIKQSFWFHLHAVMYTLSRWYILYVPDILLLIMFAPQMSQKITLVLWAIWTVRTGKWQVSCVSANVSNEVASLWGPVRTVGTEVHSWVYDHTHTACCNVTVQWAHPFLTSCRVYWHTFCSSVWPHIICLLPPSWRCRATPQDSVTTSTSFFTFQLDLKRQKKDVTSLER